MMEPKDVVYDICRCYIKDQIDVDPALLAKINGLNRSRNLAGLASCSLHFDWDKHSVNEWRFLRQVEAFFKKNSIFSVRSVCGDAAKASFMAAEENCRQTNDRLDFFYAKRGLLDPDLDSKLKRMERYISNVLGEFRPFLDEIPYLVRVTPGATAHSARRDSLPQMKMRMRPYATKGAAPYLRTLYHWFGFESPRTKVVDSNRIELVPKNWKTDRTIACEPEGNLPLQLAFDTYAKRRLRRYGIDLRCQNANQDAAMHASVCNDLVTVDFAAASDTISFNTVAWVFPWEWFSFLCSVRTPRYRGCFGDGVYHKFSSMGNGSTFTIETLIFAAACYAVGSKRFLVYGDDVIIEREYYEDYLRLTRFLGFSINVEKSFAEGPFRESCGMDSFDGCDVTPVYIRSIDRRKAVMCHLVNTLGSLTYPDGELAKYLHDLIVEFKLPLVPYQENTLSGVWLHPDDARSLGLFKHSGQVDKFKAYVAKSKRRKFVDSRGYYLWFLNKNSQVLFAGPWDLARSVRVNETSSVAVFEHGYVRKWVGWIKPTEAVPDHLYWWSGVMKSLKH